MIPQDWLPFLTKSRPSVDWQKVGAVVCLDPGETTGWAVFVQGDLYDCGQEPTPRPADMASFLRNMIGDLALSEVGQPEVILFEEYRVRGNKFKEHVGSEVVTIQNIGAIKVIADEEGIPTRKQGAGEAKNFSTDRLLRRWGLYQTNQRHANDAVRHGTHYLLFKYGRKDPRRLEAPDDQDHVTGRDSEEDLP